MPHDELKPKDQMCIRDRCGAGEKLELISKTYLWLSGAKSQGIKQLMAGGGVVLIGTTLIPLLSGMF